MATSPESVSRKSVTLPDSLWERVGQYRFFRQIPTEAEAIRQLLQAGVEFGPIMKTIVALATSRQKYVSGPFSDAYNAKGRDTFAVLDLLEEEIRFRNPSMTPKQVKERSQSVWSDANMVVNGDVDAAISFLNIAWQWLI